MEVSVRGNSFLKNNRIVERMATFYQTKSKLILTHILVWLLYLIIANLLLIVNTKYGSFGKLFIRTLFTYSNVALLFYVHVYFILNPLLKKRAYLRVVIYTLLLIVIFGCIRVLIYHYIFPYFNIGINPYTPALGNVFHSDSAILAIYHLALGYGYWYARSLTIVEREKLLLEQQKRKAEHERTEAQIAFLQAQINPHFLYNTLNFLYSKALFLSDDFAASIMALSEIMRYTITYAGKDGIVSLEKEIEHIESYMHLQRYRFNNKLNVVFEVDGEDYASDTMIPSLILISFIENAFKHGNLNDPADPLTIKISITNDTFTMKMRNKKSFGVKEISSGIGLKNITNRLDLIYQNNYHLTIDDEPLFYNLELFLQTNDMIEIIKNN